MTDNNASTQSAEGGSAATADAGSSQASLLSTTPSAPAAAPATTTAPATQPTGDSDWRSNFATGLDDDTAKTWTNVSQRYQSQQDLAKAHVNLVRSMNDRVQIPAADAKPEEWKKFWSKTAPKDPGEYKFDEPAYAPLTDSEKETRESFRQVAHRVGLNQLQLKELQDWQYEQRKVAWDAETVAPQNFADKSVRALRQEWNVDFTRNVENAKLGAREMGGGEWTRIANTRLADGGLLGDHPDMVKIWSRIGQGLAEDDRRPLTSSNQRESIQEQIAAIQQEAAKAGKLPSDREYHQRLQPLYDKLYGTAPISRRFG